MDPTVTHATFVLERSYPVAPERVFAAFADPQVKRRWFVEDRQMTIESFEMDFQVGGHDRMVVLMGEDTPFPGAPMVNHTVYQDILPGRRIVFAYTMGIGERRISASLTTVEIRPDGEGSRLVFTEQAAFFEGADGPTMRQEGWASLLGNLERELARS
jgi:uncharacterized protein YndB with AHSA1/START domain